MSRPKARPSGQLAPDTSIVPEPKPPSPSERLDSMTRERIDALEMDKERLHQRVEQLQAEVDRLAPEMTRERIDSLEADKQWLQLRIDQLQAKVDQLAPENAQLRVDLKNAEANNLVSNILIGVGGAIMSYATFTGRVGPRLADAGAVALIAGVFLLIVVNLRLWLARERGGP